MFFPWGHAMGCHHQSTKEYQEQRLRFLCWVRDSLETRLAAVNAAIDSIESQKRRDEENAA